MTDEELDAIEFRATTPMDRAAFVLGGPRSMGHHIDSAKTDCAEVVTELRKLRAAAKLARKALHRVQWTVIGRGWQDELYAILCEAMDAVDESLK